MISDNEKKIHLEDQHGNKITMNEDGITIDSYKDLILKAATDLKTDSVNATIKGSGQAKVSGAGGTEVSSSAVTTVKGSMVQIN